MKIQSNPSSWPKHVKVGSVTVAVYKRKTPAGNISFMLGYQAAKGKSIREACGTDENKALEAARKKAEVLSFFGARVAGISPLVVAEFVRLTDLTQPFGLAPAVIIERFIGWLTKHGTLEAIDRALVAGPAAVALIPRTVPVAVAEMLAQKQSNGASDKYYNDIKYRLENKFAVAFNCNVDTVTSAMIQTWLDARKMPAQTYMNFLRLINVFFEFCVARNYCEKNPVGKVETRKVRAGAVVIYTPDEMKKLLAKASDEFRPMLAICGFAGLRTEEFKRLTWGDVDFAGANIILDAGQAKTASRRVVPLVANLRAWLEPYQDKKGLVWRDGDIHHVQKTCGKLAGVTWKKNALRHSFCSYRLGVLHDAAKVAFEAGNSAKIIHGHYNALATDQAAREWFAIVPPATASTGTV